MSKARQKYYEGGWRVMIGGVPCRVNVEPTAHMLALWRDNEGEAQIKRNALIRYPQTQYEIFPQEEERIAA